MANGILSSGAPMTEVGTVDTFAQSAAPAGWLVCDGSTISRTTYAALFAKIGTTWGAGDGSTTFAVPDARGEFVRGLDLGRGVDAGRVLGTAQASQFQDHEHAIHLGNSSTAPTSTLGYPAAAAYNTVDINNYFKTQAASTGTRGTETRPRNVAMLTCIKF
ncbi:phage tail protein [Aquabacterium sp.]|uniref:phage tail protein n=1 Tax=Aquabacterium sp. TaxID=1872578 RepID=UPI0025C6E759|nr:phage tail protein [Aquabacterium sp.]